MRADECMVCKRRRVALVVLVAGRLYHRAWMPGEPQRPRTGVNLELFRDRPLRYRQSAVCLDQAGCAAYVAAKRKRQRQRSALPEDAKLRELGPPVRGTCRWCRGTIYKLDKDGHVRPQGNRAPGAMWHQGRVIHPDAEPEPDCVREYHAQAFSFRDQVGARDGGVCAGCGRDCEHEYEAWRDSCPEGPWGSSVPPARERVERFHEALRGWELLRPLGWEADHIVPLEDGGPHTLENAQTLCVECHRVKTAAENTARAARRRSAA